MRDARVHWTVSVYSDLLEYLKDHGQRTMNERTFTYGIVLDGILFARVEASFE
jgi:hypothetical protein